MTQFISIFPLSVVILPDEQLNLHIYEPKYIQLINDCIKQNKNFGSIVVLQGELMEYGVSIEITEVVKIYDDGTLDIRTKGKEVFRILESVNSIPDKLYNGAVISFPENNTLKVHQNLNTLIVDEVKKMYHLLDVDDKYNLDTMEWTSYSIAHKVGLSITQEYELLQILNEVQRLEYLRRHIKHIQPIIRELEKLKERIKMNGHFRHLNPPTN